MYHKYYIYQLYPFAYLNIIKLIKLIIRYKLLNAMYTVSIIVEIIIVSCIWNMTSKFLGGNLFTIYKRKQEKKWYLYHSFL